MKRIVVQKGHVAPREPGFESGTGTVREQELVTKIGDALAKLLAADDRFDPVVVPGDIPNGIKCDAALFLHGDGSTNPAASGYCFGYPNYPVNKKLADLIAVEFDKIPGHPPHRTDNYTRDLAGYYGYSRVDTPGPEVLVEHGFLTNPAEQAWLFNNIERLAKAEYVALCRFFGYEPREPVPPVDPTRRRAALRAWILASYAIGWSWSQIKRTKEWAEYRRLGGK